MFDFIILLVISIAIIVACVLMYLNFTPPFIQKLIFEPTQRPLVQTTIQPTQKSITQPTSPQPTQRPLVQPTQRPLVTNGNNPFVNAINSVFSLQLGSNSAEDSCAARHATAEPTLAQAHNVWKTGDRCNGGRGAVWSGSPDPNMAARMWLNSPPHASIIRGATRLACGSGPSSAVCIAY